MEHDLIMITVVIIIIIYYSESLYGYVMLCDYLYYFKLKTFVIIRPRHDSSTIIIYNDTIISYTDINNIITHTSGRKLHVLIFITSRIV